MPKSLNADGCPSFSIQTSARRILASSKLLSNVVQQSIGLLVLDAAGSYSTRVGPPRLVFLVERI